MKSSRSIINLVLKAVALAMGVVVIVLGALGQMTSETGVTFLAIGLAAMAIVALSAGEDA